MGLQMLNPQMRTIVKSALQMEKTTIFGFMEIRYVVLLGICRMAGQATSCKRSQTNLRSKFFPNTTRRHLLMSPWVTVNLTCCGQGDAHRETACAGDYAAAVTLLISAQTWKACILATRCSAAVT